MNTRTTLAADDYRVYTKLPIDWCVENHVAVLVAEQLRFTSGKVLRAISRLVRVGLVDRRTVDRGESATEIQKVRR